MSVLRIAHRSGNDPLLVPAALAQGADLVEADVHLHRGRLEVRHDERPGLLPWTWQRRSVLPRRPPLDLAALNQALPPGATLMLDLKGWQPWLGAQVRAAMAGSPPYVVCGRAWRMLDVFADQPGVRVVHSVGNRRELAALGRRLRRHRTWGVSIHRRLLTAEVVAALHEHAQVVMTWPVDTQQEHDDVVGMGVDGVISDGLDAIAAG